MGRPLDDVTVVALLGAIIDRADVFVQNLIPGAARRPGLDAEAAGIAHARLRAPADLASHPQLRARDRWRTVGTPGGEIEALLPPVEVAGGDPVMGPVPALGEHTAALRAEFGQQESGKDMAQ